MRCFSSSTQPYRNFARKLDQMVLVFAWSCRGKLRH
jgi:hypothetical protein